MENSALEKMCNKIIDVIYKTFTRKYYFVKISQSKMGHEYLIVKKKRGGLLVEEKYALHKNIPYREKKTRGKVTNFRR